MKELGIQVIPAYSPQARGRSERNFGTWQGRLRKNCVWRELRAWRRPITSLRSGISKSSIASSGCRLQRRVRHRRSKQLDLNCVFSIRAERVVAKDNTVAIGNREWQIDKTRFRHTLA